MSTAVIITGQARTFAHCFKTQREAVFRKLEDPHFFISFAPMLGNNQVEFEETARTVEALLVAYPGRVFVEHVDQPAMPEDLRERFEAASYHAPYFRSVPVEAIWRMFWHLSRGWEFYLQAPRAVTCTNFLRIRPDSHFHTWTPPRERVLRYRGDLAPPPEWYVPPGVHVPWWGSWGGVPDRFAYIVGLDAAAQYFNVFHRINELLADGCAYHPETMLARTLERAGVRVHETMDAEFTTIRTKADLAAGRKHDVPVYNNRDILNYVNARLAEEGRG